MASGQVEGRGWPAAGVAGRFLSGAPGAQLGCGALAEQGAGERAGGSFARTLSLNEGHD